MTQGESVNNRAAKSPHQSVITVFSRRRLLDLVQVIGAVALLASTPIHAANRTDVAETAEKPRRPNIVLILADDQGYGDFGLHGNSILETPHLDRFAAEGIRWTNFHVSPFCAPTRASLLTGRYSLRTGVVGVTGSLEMMKSEERTLAEMLHDRGYRTGCFGKWHNGESFPHTAQGQGFDRFFGFNGGHWNNYFSPQLLRGTVPEPTTGFITDTLVTEAIHFMKERGGPFFCYVPLNAPHTPSQSPENLFACYREKGCDRQTAAIYGMCANIDENFGRLLAALEACGKRKDTLVIFLSDNGANSDRFNAGMRGRKVSVHEGGTRVPLFMQWPARWARPAVIPQLAAHIDIFPTIVELTRSGQERASPMDGISLCRWLNDPPATCCERSLFIYNGQAMPVKPWQASVRTTRYRLVQEDRRAKRGEASWQLYDMVADPSERFDLAASRPDLVADLSARWWGFWDDASPEAEFDRRIELGHRQQPHVTLNTPQARMVQGMQFYTRLQTGRPSRSGYANDFLTNWTSIEDVVGWSVRNRESGVYELSLEVSVPAEEAGSEVVIRVGSRECRMQLRPFRARPLSLPHQVPEESLKYVNRTWSLQSAGTMELPAGDYEIRVRRTADSEGTESIMLKALHFRRVPSLQ